MALPITQAVKDLFLNNTLQTISITATPLEGSAITITEADIVQGSFSIDRSSVASSDIEIGNASSAELMMTLNNVSDFVYEGATLSVSVAVDGNTVPMGVFVVDEVKRFKTTTNIVALDKMVAFDKDADKTAFADGLTPSQVLNVCCTQCGVTLGDVTDMVNASITVNVSAIEDVFTYRDLIIWIGECTATNAFINESGSLVMKWYNGSSVATLTEENRVASDLQNYPVEITGVKIVDGDTEYISGEEGYVIKIENNPLIVQDSIATRLATIATRLVGFSYQPWSAETHPMPWIMPLDMIDFVKGETTHNTIVTNSQFWLNRNTQFAGKGESPMAKGYAQKALTKQQQNVVKGVERKSELGDQALQNQITEINNHFWFDSAGAHVSTIAGDASHGNNALLDSDSLDIRVGETVRASFGAEAVIGEVGTDKRNVLVRNNGVFLRNNTSAKLSITSDATSEFIQVGSVGDGQNIFLRPTYMLLRHGATERIRIDNTGDPPFIRLGTQGTGEKNLYLANNTIRLREGDTTLINIGTDTTSTYVQVGTAGTSSAPNRNILIRPAKIAMRSYTTEDASFAYDDTNSTPVITLGRTGTDQHNVKISNTSVALRRGTTDRILLSTASNEPWIRIGTQGTDEKNISMTDGALRLRNGTDSHLILGTDATSTFVQIGQAGTGQQNILIRPNGFYQRTASTNNASFTYDSTNGTPVITLGRTGTNQKNVYITNSALRLRNGTTTMGLFEASKIELGDKDYCKAIFESNTTSGIKNSLVLQAGEYTEAGGGVAHDGATLRANSNGSSYPTITSSLTLGAFGLSAVTVKGTNGRTDSLDVNESLYTYNGTPTFTTNLISGTEYYRRVVKDALNGIRFYATETATTPVLKIGWDGRMTYGGNSSAIGTVTGNSIDNVTLSSGTSWRNISSFSLPKGTWLVQVSIDFQTNATGNRQMCLSATSGGGEIAWIWRDLRAPVNGSYTSTRVFGLLTPTATTTYYVNGIQNSGTSLTAGGRWQAVRIL